MSSRAPFAPEGGPPPGAAVVPGVPIILTAPSGTGKTTLCRRVLSELRDLSLAVSHTTRPPRRGEREAVDYYFIDDAEFDRRVAGGRFLEWAQVHDHRYGTGIEYRTAWIEQGRDVLFDVDVQGAERLSRHFPDAAKLFLLPPTFAVLERRLRERGSETEAAIQRRLANARREIRECRKFHHLIVNDDLDEAARDFLGIIRAERVRTARRGRVIEALFAEIGENDP